MRLLNLKKRQFRNMIFYLSENRRIILDIVIHTIKRRHAIYNLLVMECDKYIPREIVNKRYCYLMAFASGF